MRKQRVLVDVFYLHVAQTGIKTYIISFCEEIIRRKETEFEYIFVPDYQTVKTSKFFRGNTSRWKNILFQMLYFFRKLFIIPVLSYYHKADLIFSPDILSPIWCRGKKISVVYDTFFWDSSEHYNSLWLKVFLTFLKASLKHNGEITTITHFSKNRLEKIEGLKHVPKSVAYPSSGFVGKTDQKIQYQKPDFQYFLHVGVMEKRKNLGMLVAAFGDLIQLEAYKDIKLVLVGSRGTRKTLDDFDNINLLIKELQLEGKVILPGYISEEELKGYFFNASAYIFPSLNEGFGLPVLEAFSFGLPVIISNQGALIEVAGNAALVLEENTKGALTSAMVQLLEDQQLRDELSKKGRNRLNEFSTEKFFLSLEDTFKHILNG